MSTEIFGFSVDQQWDYENGYHLISHPSRIAKMLAHYELYKSIVNLPGEVIECGVYKGASLVRFATFRHALEAQESRKIIGFDAFGKFPPQEEPDDKAFIEYFESDGGDGISIDGMHEIFAHKQFGNYELVAGDVSDTIPNYLEQHPELRIALLHIDVDVYKPTRDILHHLFDRIVPNGLLVLDDYGVVAGETRAVDEFIEQRKVTVEKLPYYLRPAFIRKPLGGE